MTERVKPVLLEVSQEGVMGALRRDTLPRGRKPGSQGRLLEVLLEVGLENSYKVARGGGE